MPRIGMLARILLISLAIEFLLYAIAIAQLSGGTPAGILKVVAGCAFVFLLLRALITLNMFRSSERFASPREPEEKLGLGRALRLFIAEYASVVRHFAWQMPFEWTRLRRSPKHPDDSPPILLIHGYVCNGGYWVPLRPVLERAGFRNLYTVNLDPTFGSIEQFAESVRDRVEVILRETGASQVTLIGHSMGGLVARTYVQHHGGHDTVRQIITLGTPHHGTVFAKSGLGEDSRQMEPKSPWLAALNAEDPKPVPITSIWSTHDNIITPQVSSHVPHATNIRMSGIGHLELSASKPVQAAVLEALGAAEDYSTEPVAAS